MEINWKPGCREVVDNCDGQKALGNVQDQKPPICYVPQLRGGTEKEVWQKMTAVGIWPCL